MSSRNFKVWVVYVDGEYDSTFVNEAEAEDYGDELKYNTPGISVDIEEDSDYVEY